LFYNSKQNLLKVYITYQVCTYISYISSTLTALAVCLLLNTMELKRTPSPPILIHTSRYTISSNKICLHKFLKCHSKSITDPQKKFIADLLFSSTVFISKLYITVFPYNVCLEKGSDQLFVYRGIYSAHSFTNS